MEAFPLTPEQARDDLRRAEAFGIDLSLLVASLRLSPLERLRQNDDILEFFRHAKVVRRSPPGPQ